MKWHFTIDAYYSETFKFDFFQIQDFSSYVLCY